MKRLAKIVRAIPTPSLCFNYESLIGGIPLGHLSFFYGPTGSWKSTFLIETAGLVQSFGKAVKWYDEERGYTDKWAYHYGVDIKKIQLDQNRTAVELFDSLVDDIDSEDNPDLHLLVVDSLMGVRYVKKKKVDAKRKKGGEEKKIEASRHEKASISRFLAEAIPALTGAMKAREKKGMVVPAIAFTNHFRTNPFAMFSKPTYMPGGSQIYHDAEMIVEMVAAERIKKQIGNKKIIVGYAVKGRFEKNRGELEAQYNTFEFQVFTRRNKVAPIGINKGLDRLTAGLLTGNISESMKSGILYEFNGTEFKTEKFCQQCLGDMEFKEAYERLIGKKVML